METIRSLNLEHDFQLISLSETFYSFSEALKQTVASSAWFDGRLPFHHVIIIMFHLLTLGPRSQVEKLVV